MVPKEMAYVKLETEKIRKESNLSIDKTNVKLASTTNAITIRPNSQVSKGENADEQ